MTSPDLSGISVFVTAWKRPQYLAEVFASWSQARGIDKIRSFTVALGWDQATFPEMVAVIDKARPAFGCPLRVLPDSSAARASRGMGRAIGEAVTSLFADPAVSFVVAGEEDIVVADDALEYMAWAANEFRDDPHVLVTCAHTPAGQGWDRPGAGLEEDPDADPSTVSLIPRFSPWAWGTWRDRWERTLRPSWDWECDSGDAVTSGYDWQIAARIIPQGNFVCAVPLASRSQNIGRDGGWAADPAQFDATQSASFASHREPCEFRVTETAIRM